MVSSGHVKATCVVIPKGREMQIWVCRNKGRGTPYLFWIVEPTLINKRYWVTGTVSFPVMWIQVEDWPEEWPKLRPGQKRRVTLAEWRVEALRTR